MPTISNWREYVTDDVTLVFDLDTPCFNAASSAEKSAIKVTHIETGKVFWKEENVPVIKNEKVYTDEDSDEFKWVKIDTGETKNVPFKNKTEFWGRKKKAISDCWLADKNLERVAEGLEPYTKEDFLIEDVYEVGEESHAIYNLNRQIQAVKDYLGVQKAIYIIGEGENHRHKLDLPIHPEKGTPYGQYKWERIDSRRPALLKNVREYAKYHLNAQSTPKGFEADEVIAAYGWKSHIHYKKTGKHTHILVTVDKDQMGISSLVFNPYSKPGNSTWEHPYPYLIDGYGEIYMKGNKVKGEGQKFLLSQCLNGDDSDSYSPTARLEAQGGDKATYLRLHPTKTLREGLEAVKTQYLEWFPDGVKFTSWTGKDVELTWYEWADIIFQCAYMKKNKTDDLTFTKLLDKAGIEYK